tara:strand:+ start:102 stop:401 length:300 start_codon:yes stop_codon:yes gene_type:complete
MEIKIDPLEYVEYIRNQNCCVCYKHAPSDPDHLDAIGMGRNRKNPKLYEHWSCIPLCRKHHIERHSMTIKQFEEKHHCNLWWEIYNNFSAYVEKKMEQL